MEHPAAVAGRPSVYGGLLLAVVAILLGLLAAEGGLRLARFQYQVAPVVQVGWPDPQTIQSHYAVDPDLFWVTQDYQHKLREARRTRPAIVFMGDSCTEFGQYPALTLADLLSVHGLAVQGVHLATGGWTSEQGLAQLRRDVVPLHPRVIVVFYGWNDHWMALGPTDQDLAKTHGLIRWSRHVRIAQLALKVWMGMAARRAQGENRVPPKRYLENLRSIAAEARQAGIVPVFVTAPSNHIRGHEPQYLALRHVRNLADVVPLHEQYLQLTRQAAAGTDAVLCDAAAHFAALPSPHDGYFRNDGIHFTADGDRELASVVSGCIAGVLKR
jgi:lysophospholipase L1-like esterase